MATEEEVRVQGSVGTSASFVLRLGQAFLSSASLLSISLPLHFYTDTNTSFCFLITIMGLVIPWSLALALLDGYSLLFKSYIRHKGVLVIIIAGDWVLSILTLAAASSTASVVDVLMSANISFCPQNFCNQYLLSAAMAFSLWFLSMASSLFNLWLLPSL